MGLFNRIKLSQEETAALQANNVFKHALLSGEAIEKVISGKSGAEKLIFSVGLLAATGKRILYYYQDGNKTGTETILYDKIISLTQINGFEKKMGNFVGVAIELVNGDKRIVRCLKNEENQSLINDFIFYVEGKRQ